MKKLPSVLCVLLSGAALFASSGCAPYQHKFAPFRAASTVRIIEELDIQGFDDSVSVRTLQGTFAVRTNGGAPPLPIEEIARTLLETAGLRVLTGQARNYDITLKISARGHALTKSYTPRAAKTGAFAGNQHFYVGDRVFTVPSGIFLKGTVSLEAPGAAFYQRNFRGEVSPPEDLPLTITYTSFSQTPLFLEYTKPSGRALCHRQGSLTQQTVEILGEVFGVPFLLAVIRSESYPFDEYAATALSTASVEKSDEDLLIAALKEDRAWRIRLLAAQTLGKIGGKRVIEPLIHALQDSAWQVRKQAAGTLENSPDNRVVEPLIHALQDSAWQVRQQAVETLGKIGDRRAAEPLIRALQDEEWRIRLLAVKTLGKFRDRRAVEPLIAALQDDEWRIRLLAVETLGKFRDRRAVEPLIAALQDEAYGVRYHAVVALETFRDPRALGPFIELLNSRDVQLQRRVMMALKKITGKDLSTDPDAWRKWWEQNQAKY